MLRFWVIGCCLTVAAAAAELPVKKVVLYKHGVGYFERAGELAPGESARLDFKASEMNDVLKSLTLASTGAQVAALRYDASEPIELKLSKFPFQIGQGQPVSALLDQLKGENVELKYPSETITGKILGARLEPATAEKPASEWVTLLTETGEVVTRSLGAASIRFPEPETQLQLQDYLSVLAGGRSKESRSVYIDSTDNSQHQVRASYMIPAPVWKSSYRLIFSGEGEAMLEGWAIVDNTTGEDWTKVQLALVSGRPISFISRLYEPKYVQRAEAGLPEEQAPRPTVHEGAISGGAAGRMRAKGAPPPAPRRAMMAEARPTVAEMAQVAPSDVAATASGSDLGELFEYRFAEPVTVRKNESAMLPFLQQRLNARKLLIYSDETTRHPMNAAEIENTTGKTLDGGPITVFDAGAYAGEALIATTKAGDKRLISYGTDLGTRITTKFDSSRARVRELHLRRGVLTSKSAIRETKTYTIRNVDDKDKTLIIEHQARDGYQLVDRQPNEKTTSAYRFEVKLAGGAAETFPVVEQRELVQRYAVTNLTPDVLVSYVENKEISAAAREKLAQILELKRQIAKTDSQSQALEAERRTLAEDQDRLRKNISSLNRVSGQQAQVEKYAAQLSEQEARMAQLRDGLSAARNRKAELQASLNEMIETLEF